jgi:anti-sigma-K factor RskA
VSADSVPRFRESEERANSDRDAWWDVFGGWFLGVAVAAASVAGLVILAVDNGWL